ncbi:MAG TPA: Gfo/Idh/MocA family oxidoreductase [Spirochaetia bacterium]|nr:Gfo/Idh/MocA family oxidoreductase [Spirochaetia bacterium]
MAESLPVAIIGTGKRSVYMYAPIIKALGDRIRLVGVWGRSEESARSLGEQLGVAWFTDMDRLVREAKPVIGIVCVKRPANGPVAKAALEHGINVLVETPVAEEPAEADELIAYARSHGLKIEVAEQFHRRPLEQIKLKLIESGLFGRVYSSFSDFAGHGYHGVSVMRSYLGFDARPISVTGAVEEFPLAPHFAFNAGTFGPRSERQEHALVRFEGGRIGVYHWTSVGYDSALRWWRSSRFLAEKGMGISVGVGIEVQEQLTLLAPGGEGPRFITIQRVWERCDGGALRAVKAHTGDPSMPILEWENPFAAGKNGENVQWHDDEIGVAGCLMSLVDAVAKSIEPTYGPEQGRIDQAIVLAMLRSSEAGGAPMEVG